jgi:hypothetical protein
MSDAEWVGQAGARLLLSPGITQGQDGSPSTEAAGLSLQR